MNVAKPLVGQHIPQFAIALAFAAPLLDLTERVGNFGFELVGGKGIGKSTVQHLMASVLGGALQGPDGHYWITFDTTLNGLEETMANHSDLPIILDEANLFSGGESAKVKAEHFKSAAFKLTAGNMKSRKGEEWRGNFRLVFLSSSNEPISALIGEASEGALAAADRLMTIPISPSRTHGIFESVPAGENGSDFARRLVNAAADHHGHAFRRFMKRLVLRRARDEKALRREIAELCRKFCRKVKVDPNDGSAVRVAEAFGLVYAAGHLAREFGVLPRSWESGPAVQACYELHRDRRSPKSDFVSRLIAIADNPATMKLGEAKDGLEVHAHAAVIVRKTKSKHELLIRPGEIMKVIPDWPALQHRPDVVALMKREEGHRTVKRRLAAKRAAERLFCFDLANAGSP